MENKKFLVNCGSKYFEIKHGKSAVFTIEREIDFHQSYNPPSFLYLGRVLAEGKLELLRGKTYYGHINGEGEFVHESELGAENV